MRAGTSASCPRESISSRNYKRSELKRKANNGWSPLKSIWNQGYGRVRDIANRIDEVVPDQTQQTSFQCEHVQDIESTSESSRFKESTELTSRLFSHAKETRPGKTWITLCNGSNRKNAHPEPHLAAVAQCDSVKHPDQRQGVVRNPTAALAALKTQGADKHDRVREQSTPTTLCQW